MPAEPAARSRSTSSPSAATPQGPARPAAASSAAAGPGSPSNTRAGASPAPTSWSPKTAATRTSAPSATAPNASPTATDQRGLYAVPQQLVQVRGEEALDALPGVGRGRRLRTDAGHPEQWTQHPRPVLGVVEEGVPGGWVLLDVMDDAGIGQRLLQLGRGTGQAPVATAVAGHYRAGAGQHGVQVTGQLPVVDGGHLEAGAGGQEREAAAHAEP